MSVVEGILRVRGGSSPPAPFPRVSPGVFSACAEVVPSVLGTIFVFSGILRVRGGSSGR